MLKKIILEEKLIVGIIFLNALTIFLQGFETSDKYRLVLETLDNLFTILFIIEISLKIRFIGFKESFVSNWFKFDFILILLAVPSLITYFIGVKTIDLDFLLVFRVLRVFKFFRFIKYIPKVENIINGAFKAVKSSIIVIVGFVVFNFCISILSCFLFGHLSEEYFGNPIVSFYSIFKLFTIEGWYEIPEEITQNVSSQFISFLISLYFIILLFIGGIFGLSLVNSIFVESLISENKDDSDERIKRIESKLDEVLKSKLKNN